MNLDAVDHSFFDPNAVKPEPRRCKRCTQRLALMNSSQFCFACQRALDRQQVKLSLDKPMSTYHNPERKQPEKPLVTKADIEANIPKNPRLAEKQDAMKARLTKPAAPEPVALVLEAEEVKPRQLCAVADCSKELQAHNTSGRCYMHCYVRNGTPMRDGSVWMSQAKLQRLMRQVAKQKAARYCEACGKKLRGDNTGTRCNKHRIQIVPHAKLPCAAKDCERLLRDSNKQGLCKVHSKINSGFPLRDGTILYRSFDGYVSVQPENLRRLGLCVHMTQQDEGTYVISSGGIA